MKKGEKLRRSSLAVPKLSSNHRPRVKCVALAGPNPCQLVLSLHLIGAKANMREVCKVSTSTTVIVQPFYADIVVDRRMDTLNNDNSPVSAANATVNAGASNGAHDEILEGVLQ